MDPLRLLTVGIVSAECCDNMYHQYTALLDPNAVTICNAMYLFDSATAPRYQPPCTRIHGDVSRLGQTVLSVAVDLSPTVPDGVQAGGRCVARWLELFGGYISVE